MKLRFIYILGIVTTVGISFYLGTQWYTFRYDDICLDLGGGRNPGGYPICVIER